MGGYELLDQLSEQFFRPAGGYVANFSSSVGCISEESTLDRSFILPILAEDLTRLDVTALLDRGNVPMGGELGSLGQPPKLLIHALKDPDSAHLDRVQVIKGWIENGKSYERVYDVAWSGDRAVDEQGRIPPVPDTVDIETASYSNEYGAPSLSAVWADPGFDGRQAAFYYVRVLEVPTPRHSLLDVVALGIETGLSGEAASIHERAYTSPIFYRP